MIYLIPIKKPLSDVVNGICLLTVVNLLKELIKQI